MKVSVSQVKQYKACRRAWYLHYVEELEPVQKSDALTVGTNYHALIEDLYKFGKVEDTELTKEGAMAKAYEKYIYPQVQVQLAEEWLEKPINSLGDILVGRVDGMTADGTVVEHKTTSRDIGAEYEYNLMWDEQVLAYMYLTNTRRIVYTVVRKPTIRLKKDETQDEFYERMCAWYDDDTENKIRTFEVVRTDKEVQDWIEELKKVVYHMRSDETCYKNTQHCMAFGTTCPYRSICLHYDPEQTYMEFTKNNKDIRR